MLPPLGGGRQLADDYPKAELPSSVLALDRGCSPGAGSHASSRFRFLLRTVGDLRHLQDGIGVQRDR
jgi:hypothetical protein